MADENKVITRGEVNALIAGVFPDNLTKAVIYNDLYTDARFIIGNNHVSGQPYGQYQALLKADIRIAADIQVTLTPRQTTIGASTTSVIFDITTAGTASVGTPVYSVVTATYDGGAPTSAVINGTQLTMTFPANTDYTSKEITARVKLTIDGREFESNLATVTQSRVEVTPSLSISYTGGGNVTPASGNTNAFNITANYVTVTGYTVTSPATVGATGATSVTINYPANQTEGTRTFTVTVRGRDVYGTERTDTCTFTQSSDAYTFSLTPSSSTAEFTDTSKTLTINKSNVNNVGVCAHTNTTSETISGNNLILGFNINHETYERSITVALSGTTAGGRTVSCNATITQSGASGLNLAIVYTGDALPASAGTTNEFSISAGESVTVTGYSVDVAGASMSNTGQTQATLNFPANPTDSPVTYTVTVYATTPTGDTSASTTVTQVADAYSFDLEAVSNTIAANATTAAFNLTATSVNNIAYYAAQSSNVGGISGLSSNAVTATGITPNTSESQKQIKLVLSGRTVGGRTVYVTGTTMQNADTYTLSLVADANPIAAETTLALFTITSSNVSNLGYVVSGSENVVSCTISGGKARATITENQGAARNITVRISGTTIGGRTVYASATTVQSAPSGYVFDLTPVGGEMSYVARTATSHQYEITSQNIDDSTIGFVAAGSTNATGFDYSTQVGTFNANTGADRQIVIQISAKTLSDETVYADATVIQLGVHSETDFISVTPDGTAIGAAATSVTFNISWNYAKVGTNITFTVANGITTTPASIAVTSISGSSATTVNVSANSGSSSRNPRLTASMTDVVNATHSDAGYYTQATSRSMFEFQNDFTVDWDVTSATITFTYAYLTNSNVSLAATGGAYFNSGLTQPSSSVSITPNASSRTGSFTIYFAKNDSPSQIEYVITATGNHGEAGESTSLNDSITVIHNIPDGASLVLTPCSTTYYWSTTNITFNLDWTNINPGTSSNPGITITVSNGATATPNKYYSGDNGDEDFVVSGLAPGNSYTVTVTGRPYVGDNIVRTYTITIPSMPVPSIIVEPDGGSLLASATTATFTVSWSNISTSNQITIATTGVTGGASSFTPTSTSGSTTINATIAKNSGSSAKTITLSATGRALAGTATASDSGSYTQAKSTSKIVVERQNPTTSDIAYNRSSVTFRVTWTDVHGTISLALTSGSGTLSQNSISASGSDHADITVSNIPENTGTSTIRIRMDATATGIGGETVTDYHYYDQQVNTSNYEFTIEYTGSTVGSSSGSTNKFSIVTRNATVTGFTVDNSASVSASGASSVTISYPANQDEDNGVTYTVTMKGRTTFGNDVTTTCTFNQYADSYTFTVVANTNPVAATATNTTFRVNYSYISNPGYYAATSQNINSCGTVGASGSNVQVGISANQSTSPKDIILVLSGVTDGGRTVYATGTTVQSAREIEYVTITLNPSTCLDITNDMWCNVNVSAVTISILTGNSYSQVATFTRTVNTNVAGNISVSDLALTTSPASVQVEKNSDVYIEFTAYIRKTEVNAQIDYYKFISPYTFSGGQAETNLTISSQYMFSGTVPIGQASSDVTINPSSVEPNFHLMLKGVSTEIGEITVTPQGETMSYEAAVKPFTIEWSNMSSQNLVLSHGSVITVVKDSNGNVITSISTGNGSGSVTVYASITENDGPAGNVILEVDGTDGNGNSIQGEGWYYQEAAPVSNKIWIKSGTSSVIVNCSNGNSNPRPTMLENFKVEINGTTSTALSCSYTGSSYPSGPVSATVPGVTGVTTYTISLGSWYPSTGTDWHGSYLTTEFSWRENGVAKVYTANTNSGITETFTVSVDTELSDFAIRLVMGNDPTKAVLKVKSVPITIYNKSSTVTHAVGTANIIFSNGNYYYDGSNNIQPEQSITRNPREIPSSAQSSTNITLNLTYIYLTMNTTPSNLPDFGILKIRDLSGDNIEIQVPIQIDGTSAQLYWHGTQAIGTVSLGQVLTYDPSYSTSEGIVFEVDTDSLVPFLTLGTGGLVPASGGTRTIQASWGNMSETGVTFWAEPASAVTSGPSPSVAPTAGGQQNISITIGANTGDDSRTIYVYASGKTYTQSTLNADTYISQPPSELITQLSPTSITWGQSTGEETTIRFNANSPTTAITITWNATLEIPDMTVESGAKVSGQTSYKFVSGQTLIPSSGSEFNGVVEITADTHIPSGGSSSGSHTGSIIIVAHGSNGTVKPYSIPCDS